MLAIDVALVPAMKPMNDESSGPRHRIAFLSEGASSRLADESSRSKL